MTEVNGNLAEVKEKFEEGKLKEDVQNTIYENAGYQVVGEITKEDLTYIKKLINIKNTYLQNLGELSVKKQIIVEMFRDNDNKQQEFEKQLIEKYNLKEENLELNLKEGKILKKIEKTES
jgi:hypothetical protein